jgi:hypothetical protein
MVTEIRISISFRRKETLLQNTKNGLKMLFSFFKTKSFFFEKFVTLAASPTASDCSACLWRS